jgi:uncharacterized protein
MSDLSAIWKRLDAPGHEACRVSHLADGWQIKGSAVFVFENRPCSLNYQINCDVHWVTSSTVVTGWVDKQTIDVSVERDGNGQWQLNHRKLDAVAGCIDVDLNFSPSTNLLPVRRLNLEIGASAQVRAAWLRFPSFSLEPLEQTYTRLDQSLYRYESAGGRFVAEVTVDEDGLVIEYGSIWSREVSEKEFVTELSR